MKATILMTQQEHDYLATAAAARGRDGAIAWLSSMLENGTGTRTPVEIELVISNPAANPELDWLFAEADRVQSEMEKLRHIGQASMDCMECGGSGTAAGGSLGNMCVGCEGSGVVDAPFAEPLALPDLGGFRARLRLAGPSTDLAPLRLELASMTAEAKQIAQKALAAAPVTTPRISAGARRTRQLRAPAHDVDFDDVETLGGEDDAE